MRVLEDAIRFPSDPDSTILEQNDIAVLLRSDSLAHLAAGSKALFDDLDGIFRVTSIRRGFAGGGFSGGTSLPKQMATAAGIPGADLIPETAELFLGFTSTQKAALGPPRIANLETLGYADLGPSGYFAHGTHMHLSHLFEDVAAWYQTFDFQARVDTTFRPGLDVPARYPDRSPGARRHADGRTGQARLCAAPSNRSLGLAPERLAPRSRCGRGR